MFNKLFFTCLLFYFVVFSSFSISSGHWIFSSRFLWRKSIRSDFNKETNKTDFFRLLPRNVNKNRTESNTLFWATSDIDNGTSLDSESQIKREDEANNTSETLEDINDGTTSKYSKSSDPSKIEQKNEEKKNQEAFYSTSGMVDLTPGKKIILQRNNCNLEISIQEAQDLKLELEFQKLENNTSGKCCITLNEQKNNLLAVLISNLHLFHNGSQGEVVKVIISNSGSNFTLKEHYGWNNYQPLLLTETNKVYIVLLYEVTGVPLDEQNSHFNLEVFSYGKYKNSHLSWK